MKPALRGSPLLLAFVILLSAAMKENAQPPSDAPSGAASAAPAPAEPAATSSTVTLNVEDALITQILNAFSRQTGRSIVIGPEVTGRTTVRLTGVSWNDAMDAVLKPFGYTHYEEGGATVVTGVDPVQTRLITLKYLDASDVEEVLRGFLSPRGKLSRLTTRSQSWGISQSRSDTVAGGETMGKRLRSREDEQVSRSKTLVVSDVPSVLTRISAFLDEIDRAPQQVLIEARFVEVNPRILRDVGVEFGFENSFVEGHDTYSVGGSQVSGGVAPGNFTPFSTPTLNANRPFNAGLSLSFLKLTEIQYQLLVHALQEDASANTLSAPRLLTINNQEAVIIVGTKYPIINSDASAASGGGAATITTSLRGYEDIGIQLNVLPQISEQNLIHMIVRPSVRELIGTKSGKTVSGDVTALTEYPVISTRETETQVVLQNGQTIVIGGLLKDRESKTVIKVPWLGDLPGIGALFRRETIQNEKIDLLIFLTASIVPAEGSALVNAKAQPLTNRAEEFAQLPSPVALANPTRIEPLTGAPAAGMPEAVPVAEPGAALPPPVPEPAEAPRVE